MKPKPDYTPWQLWAQSYMNDYAAQRGTPRDWDMDSEDADKYSHAAWHECKRRVIEILIRRQSSYTSPDAPSLQINPDIEFIDLAALEEVRKL